MDCLGSLNLQGLNRCIVVLVNRLNNFDPSPGGKFSWRQLELMDHDYSRGTAQDIVEVRSMHFCVLLLPNFLIQLSNKRYNDRMDYSRLMFDF